MNWVTPQGLVHLYEEEEALLAELVARVDIKYGAAYDLSPVVGLSLLEPCS